MLYKGMQPIATLALGKGLGMDRQLQEIENAVEALARQAALALFANHRATRDALADCELALKRIVKRAELLPSHERIEIKQTCGPHLEFAGQLLAQTEFETSGREPTHHVLEIWETRGGALVAAAFSEPSKGGSEFAEATVVPPSGDIQAMRFAVLDAFEWSDPAQELVTRDLGWSLVQDVD